jgi:hypothetical protein
MRRILLIVIATLMRFAVATVSAAPAGALAGNVSFEIYEGGDFRY